MTEIEKIEYAKSFIDKLASGIDPTDGTIVPDEDIILNPRISKCFLYVSDILARVIENPASLEKENNISYWHVTKEVIDKFECSLSKVLLPEITERINYALHSVERIKKSEVRKWLANEGYLAIVYEGAKSSWLPTQKGFELGLIHEKRLMDNQKPKNFVYYDLKAQEFIKAHLVDIVAFIKNQRELKAINRFERHSKPKHVEITRENLLKFEFSKVPLRITQITEKLNALRNEEGHAKLKATDLTEWLCGLELLDFETYNGKRYKAPTQKGREIGMSVQDVKIRDEDVRITLYNEEAQKFIIDNIHKIIKVI